MARSSATAQAMRLLHLTQAAMAELDRDLPINYLAVLFRVAAAGDDGVDQAQAMDELHMNSASMSRTVQSLSDTHWRKDRPGAGYIDRAMDPQDLRRRILRLTKEGKDAVARIGSVL